MLVTQKLSDRRRRAVNEKKTLNYYFILPWRPSDISWNSSLTARSEPSKLVSRSSGGINYQLFSVLRPGPNQHSSAECRMWWSVFAVAIVCVGVLVGDVSAQCPNGTSWQSFMATQSPVTWRVGFIYSGDEAALRNQAAFNLAMQEFQSNSSTISIWPDQIIPDLTLLDGCYRPSLGLPGNPPDSTTGGNSSAWQMVMRGVHVCVLFYVDTPLPPRPSMLCIGSSCLPGPRL
jgi:hypothetical protein